MKYKIESSKKELIRYENYYLFNKHDFYFYDLVLEPVAFEDLRAAADARLSMLMSFVVEIKNHK